MLHKLAPASVFDISVLCFGRTVVIGSMEWHTMLSVSLLLPALMVVARSSSSSPSKSSECWFWMATICCLSINKMGQLYRMLILKACPYQQVVDRNNKWHGTHLLILKARPYQQIVTSNKTETTNGTAPICWSARWVNHPDCRFCPHFDISCHSETTKWVARPIWLFWTAKKLNLIFQGTETAWYCTLTEITKIVVQFPLWQYCWIV